MTTALYSVSKTQPLSEATADRLNTACRVFSLKEKSRQRNFAKVPDGTKKRIRVFEVM